MFRKEERQDYTLVAFEIPGGVLDPKNLDEVIRSAPEVDFTRGVVISGRGPVWLFAGLVHHYHPAKWVATHDPRLGGAVVVSTHSAEKRVGDVVPV